ncbi:MAG: hypothetical protein NXI30_14180 [bacterium]|nr:hypothetical protein [bacterium]
MAIAPMNDTPESPEQRLQRRRIRRWKRRARIAGPFLGLPLLVGTLALSVDLITYSPAPAREKLTDRPLPTIEQQKPSVRVPSSATVMSDAAPVVTPQVPAGKLDLDLGLETDAAAAAPAPPYAIR